MSTNPTKRIEEIDRRLEELPKGTLTYKKINGKEQPYIQRTIDGEIGEPLCKTDRAGAGVHGI